MAMLNLMLLTVFVFLAGIIAAETAAVRAHRARYKPEAPATSK